MKIGNTYTYRECGESAKVKILSTKQENNGETIELQVLGDIAHGNIIKPEASFQINQIFSVWRTNGEGRDMCGWTLWEKTQS